MKTATRKPENKKKMRTVGAAIEHDGELASAIERIRKDDRRTVSDVVRFLLEEAIAARAEKTKGIESLGSPEPERRQ